MTNINEEIWKDIPGFEGYYQVSNLGRIKRLERYSTRSKLKEKILKLNINNISGYVQVHLFGKTFRLHRLVAETFLHNPKLHSEVNHLDEVKTNNRVDNLAWCTPSENINHSIEKFKVKRRYLSPIEKLEILDLTNKGWTIVELRKKFGTSNRTIERTRQYNRHLLIR